MLLAYLSDSVQFPGTTTNCKFLNQIPSKNEWNNAKIIHTTYEIETRASPAAKIGISTNISRAELCTYNLRDVRSLASNSKHVRNALEKIKLPKVRRLQFHRHIMSELVWNV